MSIIEFLSQPIWQRLGLTLLHFLWQGLAVAILLSAFVRVFRVKHGNARYATYLLAFVAMIACPVATFIAIDISVSPDVELVAEAESAELFDITLETALPGGSIRRHAEERLLDPKNSAQYAARLRGDRVAGLRRLDRASFLGERD